MRKRMRGGVVLGAVVAASLILAACGSSDSSSSTDNGGGSGGPTGSITVDGSQPENPLIPTATNETGGGNVVDAMWTGLVSYNIETGKPENAMAESIESSDNTNWTIKIKPGWKFQDGTVVTAKSYVDAWNYGAYGPNGQNNNYFFAPIAGYDAMNPAAAADGTTPKPTVTELTGLKVVDDTTFTVQLSSPSSVFPVMVGYTAFYPMPDSFFADPKAFATKPIGNGPFQFVSFTPSQDIKLTAFPDYGGADKPKVKDVDFKIYQSLDAAYTDVVAGNLDVLRQMPASALAGDTWKTDLAGRSNSQAIAVIQTVSFPLYDKQFDNARCARRSARPSTAPRSSVSPSAAPGTRRRAGSPRASTATRPTPVARPAPTTRRRPRLTSRPPVASRARSRWRTTPTVATRSGSTRPAPRSRPRCPSTARASRTRSSARSVRPWRGQDDRDVPYRLAGRLPVDPELPGAALRHGCVRERRSLVQRRLRQPDEAGSGGEDDRRGERPLQPVGGHPREGDAGHPDVVLRPAEWLVDEGRQRQVRLARRLDLSSITVTG